MMPSLFKNVFLFLICTSLVFAISYGALFLVNACESGKIDSPPIDSVATAIFMLFCFPVWIMGKGSDIFQLGTGILLTELLVDASFYGLILSLIISYSLQRKKPARRSVE